MLKKVEKALLLTDVPSFRKLYTDLAEEVGVELEAEKDWAIRYRVNADVVILGSKYLDKLNEAYYPIAVLLLKSGESPAPYIKRGISRFIFDYQNQYELFFAFFKQEATVVHASFEGLSDIIKDSGIKKFQFGDYDFQFDKNIYRYKGKPIYLCNATKKYLAEWLLNRNKENKRRMILCNLRKKFGKDFLKDVDRFGQLKGGKNEQ